ncbi:MAG TPA: SUMF1/EgtB/PvdO family nonheme iron enzyme, partial [Candidatus Cloacimonadota bacterium]|nr:SUMF1/EgtB/PvdO family nonheme iron enzyme [Candidatus Cloacimonadota bacterium]
NTSADGYRLPTEAEWEGISRYGAMNMAYSGSNTLGDVGWYVNNSSGTTHIKGQKQANISKIHDMTGNVFEWCWDWYGAYNSGSSTNPLGADTGTHRIVRGGSYSSDTEPCMNVYRSQFSPEIRQSNIGLRLVRKNQFPLF